jgi:hypothetical protein
MRRRVPVRAAEEFPGRGILEAAWSRWEAGDRSRAVVDALVEALTAQLTAAPHWHTSHWYVLRLAAGEPDEATGGRLSMTGAEVGTPTWRAAREVVERVRGVMWS